MNATTRAGLVIVACVLVALAFLLSRPANNINGLKPGDVVYFSKLGRDHVYGNVVYAQSPPIGGNHRPVWQNCGIYSTPLEDTYAVHALEHGAVWLTYNPKLEGKTLKQLYALVKGHTYLLVSPYLGQTEPVVANAWGAQMRLKKVDQTKLKAFMQKFEQNREAPEPGAPCVGGFGNPEQ